MPTPAIDLEAIRADHLAEVARLEAAHTGEVGALRNAIAEHGAELVLLVEVHADAFARLENRQRMGEPVMVALVVWPSSRLMA